MTIRSFRGHFSPEDHHGLEVGGIYWHFVDVMWIVVYVTVYILYAAGDSARLFRKHAEPVPQRGGGVPVPLADDRLLRADRDRRSLINRWVGLAVFLVETGAIAWWLTPRGDARAAGQAGARRRARAGERRLLVIANETVGGRELLAELRRHGRGRDDARCSW